MIHWSQRGHFCLFGNVIVSMGPVYCFYKKILYLYQADHSELSSHFCAKKKKKKSRLIIHFDSFFRTPRLIVVLRVVDFVVNMKAPCREANFFQTKYIKHKV